jgi:hypothetical protein
MTQKLSEIFNLPPAEENTANNDTDSTAEGNPSIDEQRAIIQEVDLAIDKIDAALPYVNDLDISDRELDDLSDLAKEKFQDLIDLGMNVEARFSGHILATAGTLLGHAITAKQAKLDKKLRMVDLQLKKARLDAQIEKDSNKSDGDKIIDAEDGRAVVLDRNELLKQILGKTDK